MLKPQWICAAAESLFPTILLLFPPNRKYSLNSISRFLCSVQIPCVCLGQSFYWESRWKRGWFHRNCSLWSRDTDWKCSASFSCAWLWRQVLQKKYTKTEGTWRCFVRAGTDRLKRRGLKACEAEGKWKRENNQPADLLYLFQSCHRRLLQKSNAALIKEVNHFPALRFECDWGFFYFWRTNQVVIKNFIRQKHF